ncbi:MAG: rhomboid family intramembrane serine protease [Muribaculaceae bacterium]|nr:rhomboid family intramembrane serine protease [Muribaculaceae bacterium]
MSVFDSFKNRYTRSSLLMRFIIINITVFVVLRIIGLFSFLTTGTSYTFVQWVELPSSVTLALHRPWTIITYMFSHYEVLHILFNLLWLYWLGRIFLEFFTPRQLGGLYVIGGLGGAFLYLLCYNLIPNLSNQGTLLLGASASVMAIVVAIAVYRPDYRINLLFFGGISLKWIAIITVFIDLIGIESENMGGHIAHLGGMLVGLWFGLAIRRGHDITSWINRCIDSVVSLFKWRPSHRKAWKPVGGKAFEKNKTQSANKKPSSGMNASSSGMPSDDEKRLDDILGKLKRSGYGALSDEEKEFLFNASRKR